MSENILNKRQEARLNMFEVVELVCNENQTAMNTRLAFKEAFEEITPVIANIKTASLQSGAVTTGIAAGKKISKKELSQKTAIEAGQLYAFAVKTNNAELKAAADFSVSDLFRMKDGEMALRCQTIHDLLAANVDALKDYGVTNESNAALQDLINGYAQTVPRPRTAIANRSTIKANIRAMFDRVDKILTERMDKLIEGFAADFPDFVSNYKNARKIVDPKPKKKQNGEGNGDGGNNPPA